MGKGKKKRYKELRKERREEPSRAATMRENRESKKVRVKVKRKDLCLFFSPPHQRPWRKRIDITTRGSYLAKLLTIETHSKGNLSPKMKTETEKKTQKVNTDS
jgi:hypothetical protein